MDSEKELKEKIEQYKKMIETIPHGVQENDLNGKITFVNKAHCKITGYSYKELTSMYIWDLYTVESEKKQLQEYLKHLVTEQPEPTPYKTKNKTNGGRIIDIQVEWNYKRDSKGNLTGFISIITDTTEKNKTEQKVSIITKTALDGFWINDNKGQFLEVNDSYCKMIGYTREELLNMYIKDVDANENSEETDKHMEIIIKQGYDAFETKHKRKDGNIIDIEISVNYLDQNGGQCFVFIRDITERKKSENELHKHRKQLEKLVEERAKELKTSEERWKALVMNSQDIIMHLDSEDKIQFINRIAIPGLTVEQVIGKSIYDFILPEHYDIAREGIKKARKTGKANVYEVQVGTKIKERNWFRTTVSPIVSDKKITDVIEITYDITEKKQAEIALVEEKEKLAVTLKSIGDAVIATDTQGTVTIINEIAEKLIGWKADEAVGKPLLKVFNIINEQTKEPVESPVDKVLKKGTIIGLANHTVLISKNGKEIPIEDSGAPIRDNEGNVIGVVLVFRDVREKRKKELELKETQESLSRSEKLALVGKLSSSIAHELRNPLGAIKNAQYFLKSRLKKMLDPEKHELELKFIDGINDEVDRSNRIINDLLDFSRQKKLKKNPAQFGTIIDKILETIKVPEKIKINCNIVQKEDINVDSEQLEYVFRNILINAIQSIEQEGIININGSIVMLKNKKKNMEICFQDTGCGITDDIKDKIFEPLVSTKVKGTGLGLAIVKNIINAHDGNIFVESKEGKGSTFRILIPVEK